MNRKEFYIEVAWGRIAVVTYNKEDLPLVILCHGRCDSADTFVPLIKLLPPAYHYVTFDLPGCGYSDKFPPGNVIVTFTIVPALKVVADFYGDKKFIYIGHSGGGELGVLYNALTMGKRITKFVDIDFLTVTPHVIPHAAYGTVETLSNGTVVDFKDWFENFYIDFFKPDNYRKLNGSLETAPSYTMEQALTLMKEARYLSSSQAELVLRRNLRADPKNTGKFKFVWDQRQKIPARVPFGRDFLMKVRERYPLPTLSLITSDLLSMVRLSSEPNLPEALQGILPFYKLVEFNNHHDLHLIIPEKLVPYIIEFMEMDITTIKPRGRSKI